MNNIIKSGWETVTKSVWFKLNSLWLDNYNREIGYFSNDAISVMLIVAFPLEKLNIYFGVK